MPRLLDSRPAVPTARVQLEGRLMASSLPSLAARVELSAARVARAAWPPASSAGPPNAFGNAMARLWKRTPRGATVAS
jgi:hypothetical protein